MVYLEHPGLELLVEHDIETEELKAAIRLFGLATSIDVLQLRLDRNNSLHNNGFDLVPDLACRPCHSTLALLDRRLRHDAFKAVVEAQFVCVVVKLVILFVQGVVGQVSEKISEVLRRVVLLRGQSNKSISVQEDGHWVDHRSH